MGRRLVVEEGDVLDRFRFAHALVVKHPARGAAGSAHVSASTTAWPSRSKRGRASSSDLAFHFGEAAALADAGKAVEYASLAATEATDRLAFEQAVHFRRRAIEAERLARAGRPRPTGPPARRDRRGPQHRRRQRRGPGRLRRRGPAGPHQRALGPPRRGAAPTAGKTRSGWTSPTPSDERSSMRPSPCCRPVPPLSVPPVWPSAAGGAPSTSIPPSDSDWRARP